MTYFLSFKYTSGQMLIDLRPIEITCIFETMKSTQTQKNNGNRDFKKVVNAERRVLILIKKN